MNDPGGVVCVSLSCAEVGDGPEDDRQTDRMGIRRNDQEALYRAFLVFELVDGGVVY